jgi:hypothetical protein
MVITVYMVYERHRDLDVVSRSLHVVGSGHSRPAVILEAGRRVLV